MDADFSGIGLSLDLDSGFGSGRGAGRFVVSGMRGIVLDGRMGAGRWFGVDICW
jgi:hypothetical protein